MIGRRLTKFAKEHSLTVRNEIAYGYYNGYIMTINQSHYHISVSFAVRIYDTPYGRKYSDLLCDHQNKVLYSVSDIVFTDTYMEIIFNDTGNTIAKMKSCIDLLTDMMKADEITSNQVCSVCGKPIDPQVSSLYLYDGRALIMNDECVATINGDLARRKRKYNSLKNKILVKLKLKRAVSFPEKIVKLK